MYYPNAVQSVRQYLLALNHVPKYNPDSHPDGDYLLWMCDEIEKMDEWSLHDALKASRWIGWIFGALEAGSSAGGFNQYFPWKHSESRLRVSRDAEDGLMYPIWLRWMKYAKRR